MADFYEIPGGLAWCKENLKIIHQNKDLFEIQNFGDKWRGMGHRPLLHVVSPAMGYDFNKHDDASGIVDNIPAHIDQLIVDFNNLESPEQVLGWTDQGGNQWQIWEYESGKVRFNGTPQQFLTMFKIGPETTQGEPGTTTPGAEPGTTPTTGTLVFPARIDIHIHHEYNMGGPSATPKQPET